jgi:uncharacterized membrane protein (UPF0182 family)
VRIPRFVLLALCVLLTAAAYYLILFTQLASPYRGSYGGAVITDVVAVLAIFACLEVIRTERVTAARAVAGALAAPLLLVILLTLWYGLRRYAA